MGKEHQTWDRI